MKHSDKRKLAVAGIIAALICGLISRTGFVSNFDVVTVAKAADDTPSYISWEMSSDITPNFEGLELSVKGSLQRSSDAFGEKIRNEQKRIEEERKEEERLEEERLAQEAQEASKASASNNSSAQSQNINVSGDGVAGNFTLYGVDCYGCSGQYTGIGGTASGILMDINRGVQQADGSWLPGITYNGYYIVAAGPQYPMGTIIQISNHGFAGAGLIPGVPFLAIVADRGGAIYGNKFDLYAGSESALQIYSNPGFGTVTIVG